MKPEVFSVIEKLKELGYKTVKTDGNFVSIVADDRIEALTKIAKELHGEYDPNGKGSSVGRVELPNKIKILAKPGKNGVLRVNKGSKFEKDFVNALNSYINSNKNFDKIDLLYRDAISKIESTFPDENYRIISAKFVGNTKIERSLHINSNRIYCGDSSYDIGRAISDITLTIQNTKNNSTKDVYLSLKYGPKVTLANLGTKKILTDNDIKSGEIKTREGINLLHTLGVDCTKFCEVFNNYVGKVRKSNKNVEIVTDTLKNSQKFKEFLYSVLGYGYIFVHWNKGIRVFEMTESKMKDILEVQKATVEYPIDGGAKRVDIIVDCKGIEIKFNIRSKKGGVYPTHLLSDYKFKDNI